MKLPNLRQNIWWRVILFALADQALGSPLMQVYTEFVTNQQPIIEIVFDHDFFPKVLIPVLIAFGDWQSVQIGSIGFLAVRFLYRWGDMMAKQIKNG